MKRFGLILLCLLNWISLHAQVFDVDTLQYTGDINNRINLVILGDGYQAGELPKFVVDANNFTKAVFQASPFAEYKDHFNVFIIKVPSRQSGASHPGTATDVTEPAHPVKMVDNYFGSTFDVGKIHRLLVPTKHAAITNVLASNFPAYDQVVVLVNDPNYGGSGGWLATTSLHSAANEIAIHELGHSFSGLKDEYYAGDGYALETFNMTQVTDRNVVRWKNWLDHKEVGIYQHCCGGNSSKWYRPHQNCKMRSLGAPFCAVCVESTIEKIHSLVSPIDAYSPSSSTVDANFSSLEFKLNLIKPSPNTLKVSWLLNGVVFSKNVDALSINANNLIKGENVLMAIVQDTTQLLRVDNHASKHSYRVSWKIQNAASGSSADLSALAVSHGTLAPAFAKGTRSYSVSVAQTVSSVKITPTAEDAAATITVNGTSVSSGAASSAIMLDGESTPINIVLTAQNGITSKTYTINVVKEQAPVRVAPSITFNNETRTYSTSSFNLQASSNSTGTITYQIVEELSDNYPGDVSLSGAGNATVTIVKSGKVKLKAMVDETDHHFSGEAQMELTVNKATAQVTITELNQEFNGNPRPVTVTSVPAGLPVTVLYDGVATVPHAIGEYAVSAAVTDNNYTGAANAVLLISTPTGVSDPEIGKDIKLYPNPTAGKAQLEFGQGTTAQITVTDLAGHIISQASAKGSYEINLEAHAAGIYLVTVQLKGKTTATFKLQKQ